MLTLLKIKLLLALILVGITYNSCEEEETYDMFSYKVGNEYYYNYYLRKTVKVTFIIEGVETWRVISKTEFNDSNIYLIERKLNGKSYIISTYTTIIKDSIRFINAVEFKEKSTFSILGIEIPRNHDKPEFVVDHYYYGSHSQWTFKADSGLTEYSYYHPPNHIVNESLTLDSIRISR
jgi:hypothetical protein